MQNEAINALQLCLRSFKSNCQKLFIIGGKIFDYFSVTAQYFLTAYASQSALKSSIMEANRETQLKMHFQPFPSIARNISEILCVNMYTKYVFMHLNDSY